MIIGLAGFQGVGKSTLASYCVSAYGLKELSFADPLKRIVQDLYGFTDQQMYGPSQYRNAEDWRYPRPDGTHLTPRMALERFGTEAGRYCFRDTWCNKAMELARTAIADPGRHAGAVFSDARFINEFEAIRSAGGYVVRLVHPDIQCGDHESETGQGSLPDSYFDLVIDTSGAKAETQAKFDSWYNGIARKAT